MVNRSPVIGPKVERRAEGTRAESGGPPVAGEDPAGASAGLSVGRGEAAGPNPGAVTDTARQPRAPRLPRPSSAPPSGSSSSSRRASRCASARELRRQPARRGRALPGRRGRGGQAASRPIDAPRLVSSDASPTRPEWAVTCSTPAARAAAWEPQPHHLRRERRGGPEHPDRACDAALHEPDVPRLALLVRLPAADREPATPSPSAASSTSAQRRALTSLRRIPAMNYRARLPSPGMPCTGNLLGHRLSLPVATCSGQALSASDPDLGPRVWTSPAGQQRNLTLRRHPVVAVRRAPVRREADRPRRRAGDLPKMPAIQNVRVHSRPNPAPGNRVTSCHNTRRVPLPNRCAVQSARHTAPLPSLWRRGAGAPARARRPQSPRCNAVHPPSARV